MATPEEITAFLKEFKLRMERKDRFMFSSYRGVNRDTISYLCIQPCHVKEIISDLTFENYLDGPIVSENPKLGNLWAFGYFYNEHKLYIKLSDNFSFDKAKCISFHFACDKMEFPHKISKSEDEK